MKNPINLAIIILLPAVSSLSAATHYVSLESTNPTPPYTNWITAATNIQDAADASGSGDIVLVTNGVYASGATEPSDTNDLWMGFSRVVVSNAISLRSVNGPQFTVIDGGATSRCMLLSGGASLTGFTLTNGHAWFAGGGVSCTSANALLTNCAIVGNSVTTEMVMGSAGGGVYGCTLYNCTLTANSAGGGGGACVSTLYDCTLTGNSAVGCSIFRPGVPSIPVPGYGGGAYFCTLYNCTLTSNSADTGGGAHWCTLSNSTLSGNSANQSGGADSCTLSNCTLSGNSANWGGGASLGTLYNCTLTGNSANWGGGALESTLLYNCLLTGNSADAGGGAFGGTLYNCTVVDNTATESGGGLAGSTLTNCIVAYNAAWVDDNYTKDSTMSYCCTVPLPTNGVGNISVPPQFVDYPSGNLRLRSNSPCINAGNNSYLTDSSFTNCFDLDGNPRIVSGMVDIGAYEYQGAGSRISYAWLQQYSLPTDGSADFIDPDQDGMNNWQEWVCGTNPTNAVSALRMVSATPQGTSPRRVSVTWQSVVGVNYFLQHSANLSSPFTILATNILGQQGTTSYADTNATGPGPFFYRVGVAPP